MKVFGAGVMWLAGFCGLGFVVALHFPQALHGHARLALPLAGLLVFGLAAWAGWLPGLRKRRAAAWGVAQAGWLIGGFIIAQLAGVLVCSGAFALLARLGHPAPASGAAQLATGALTGYLTASFWSFWYIRRLGPARLQDGSALGIAWRAAPGRAYLVAGLLAALIIMVVIILVHLVPPDMAAVRKMPSAGLFAAPGWPAFLLLVLAVFIAPPVEEYVFRGGVFSALASRVSPFWAGVLTTALFMAVHAPEKIYYPAGFIDVGLMAAAAAWLRVKFRSIRPGILLHLLYNAGLMLAAGAVGGG
jgi:membrane protease YdiL (CAAX protease family)